MEDWLLSSSRRHGNGLLDRLSSHAASRQQQTPGLHVRNRWSSLKLGYPPSAASGPAVTDRLAERSVI
ncbi:hypothetical protein [Candidatus Magnetaquicoccus inordinatus]|uniref:hypothetical protein n=1 Tax=Candidatus Magnetaquicoccus inordinatus TaxID=2496818 RepID=UPI00102C6C43|nr:hypothetical protein [Candidatus Magnetaquicoccus inordinatus]